MSTSGDVKALEFLVETKDDNRCLHHKVLSITPFYVLAANVAAGFVKHDLPCQAQQPSIQIPAEYVIAGGRIHGACVVQIRSDACFNLHSVKSLATSLGPALRSVSLASPQTALT